VLAEEAVRPLMEAQGRLRNMAARFVVVDLLFPGFKAS
jgi:hypothetical protein